MSIKIEIRNLEDLSIHPAINAQPRLSDDELLAWRKGMKRRGETATPPLYVTADNQIVDGRHRYWCARKLNWKTIPVVVVKDDEVCALILETITNRRHYTKGQLAYIVAPMLEDVFKEAQARMISAQNNHAAGAALHSVQSCSETPESIATDMGVSYRVLAQAREIYDFYEVLPGKFTLTDRDGNTEKEVTLREFFEPRIMLLEDPENPRSSRAYGLGAVLAGIKEIHRNHGKNTEGTPHGGGRPKKVNDQLDLFERTLDNFEDKFNYWQKWDEDTRKVAAAKLPSLVESMPDDLLAEFSKVIKTEIKRREK